MQLMGWPRGPGGRRRRMPEGHAEGAMTPEGGGEERVDEIGKGPWPMENLWPSERVDSTERYRKIADS